MATILFVDSWAGIGGGQRILLSLLRAAVQRFDCVVATPPGPSVFAYEQAGARVCLMPVREGFFARVRTVRTIAASVHPNIVHMHGLRSALWARFALFGLSGAHCTVYTVHGNYHVERAKMVRECLFFAERILNKGIDRLVAVSSYEFAFIKQNRLIHPTRLRRIINGIALETQQKKPKNIVSISASPPCVFLSVCRLHAQKDVATILRACAILKTIPGVTWRLDIVGDGPLREECEKLADQLCVRDVVRFMGEHPHAHALMRTADVVILSSKSEGLPLVVLEASAVAKPVIASSFGGANEVILSQKTGIIFPVGSAEALVVAMNDMRSDVVARQRFGKNGRRFVRARFGEARMGKEYLKLHQSLLHEGL